MHEFFWLEAGKARFLCKLCQSQEQEQQLTLFFNEYLEHSYWPQVTVLEKRNDEEKAISSDGKGEKHPWISTQQSAEVCFELVLRSVVIKAHMEVKKKKSKNLQIQQKIGICTLEIRNPTTD